jgi:hypothetical protein
MNSKSDSERSEPTNLKRSKIPPADARSFRNIQ